jgi:prevent-host-death family protein
MKEVALYEAKNKLSALIQEIEETGGEIVITRHGKPAARLSPVRAFAGAEREAAFKRLAALRDTQTDAGMAPFDWKAAVEEGRE